MSIELLANMELRARGCLHFRKRLRILGSNYYEYIQIVLIPKGIYEGRNSDDIKSLIKKCEIKEMEFDTPIIDKEYTLIEGFPFVKWSQIYRVDSSD